MTKCQHEIADRKNERGFSGSVAAYPHSDENRAAHGCITYTEVCRNCGAERDVNQNQCHYEYGNYGLSRVDRDERAAKIASYENDMRQRADVAQALALAFRIDAIDRNRALISICGRPSTWYSLDGLRDAAQQNDNGDGLVSAYRGMMLIIRRVKYSTRAAS